MHHTALPLNLSSHAAPIRERCTTGIIPYYRSLFGLAGGRQTIDMEFGKAVTSGKKKCLSPEERRNLKTGMDKIYPVVDDTDFTALIGQFKKADDR